MNTFGYIGIIAVVAYAATAALAFVPVFPRRAEQRKVWRAQRRHPRPFTRMLQNFVNWADTIVPQHKES